MMRKVNLNSYSSSRDMLEVFLADLEGQFVEWCSTGRLAIREVSYALP
ncbi:hypothetical protein L195_g000762 [Trifolium pratense]|uniref:Uncharacterized protein n=1 Tax=Trifolium pratense TaxID=57577 RepID=A0A2K3NMT0_TRIPR|nr:hypothetical protein L195_g000762 [Trifolium pratense]